MCSFVLAVATSLSAQQSGRALFNGKDLKGWQQVGPGSFVVKDGMMKTEGGMGMLWYTREKIAHATIRVVFKLTGPRDNSGIFIRIPQAPPDPWFAVHQGYEIQIFNPSDEYHRTGCLYSLTKALNLVDAKVGEWNAILITLDGLRTVVEVNDLLVTDFTDGDPVPEKKIWYEPERGPRPERGYIGLQNHDDTTRVHFKEVRVRPLK